MNTDITPVEERHVRRRECLEENPDLEENISLEEIADLDRL